MNWWKAAGFCYIFAFIFATLMVVSFVKYNDIAGLVFCIIANTFAILAGVCKIIDEL